MRALRLSMIALLVLAAVTGCKKGSHYIRTAPAPAIGR